MVFVDPKVSNGAQLLQNYFLLVIVHVEVESTALMCLGSSKEERCITTDWTTMNVWKLLKLNVQDNTFCIFFLKDVSDEF